VVAVFCLPGSWVAAAGPTAGEQQLLSLVNQERQARGLRQLQWDSDLAEAAKRHTELMARHSDLSHQFRGEPPLQQRVGAAGAHFNSVAENVAYAPTVERIHRGLMNSAHHRANILNPDYNAIGIAIVARGDELYVTQDFAHVIPNYGESQFQDVVVGTVQRERQQRGIRHILVHKDPRLKKAACSGTLNAKRVLQNLPGATELAIYTSSDPNMLPPDMQKAATDATLHRMNIGVCFKSGGKSGFSKYWVVAAFYPVD
jgi:hypothetical protein